MFNVFKNKFNFIVVSIIFIAAIGAFVIFNNIAQNKIKIIKKLQYNIYAKNIYDKINILIKNKANLTLAIALSVSKNDNIIQALKTQNLELLQLKKFSQSLQKNVKLNNAWFQIIDNKGNSFYRSWIEKRGDPIIKSRLDVAKMIDNPQIMSTISTGKFDMTFKSMVPIYEKSTFIGMFEIITHFNSIAVQLLNSDIDSIILVDKKYKHQLSHPFTKRFIDDYYVVNKNVKKNIVKYLKNKGVNNYIYSDKKYILDRKNNKFIVTYTILDIYNKPMGSIVAFKDLDSLNVKDIEYIKTNMISYSVLFFLIFALIGYYFLTTRHTEELDNKVFQRTKELNSEKEHMQAILDTNPNIILVTRDAKIVSANKRFLKFFDCNSLDIFKKNYSCICDMFLTLDDIAFPEDKMIDGKIWAEYLATNLKEEHIALLRFNNEDFTFVANGSYLEKKGDILLTFQNITDLKKQDKLLFEQSKLASMGEMIGNIAHQWRQPLSVISTAATGMKLQKEYDMLTDEIFNDACDSINDNAQYLSKTIDDFRNFIKGDREIVSFKLSENIESFLHLVKSNIKNHNIEIVKNLDDTITINGYPNELNQCFINIFNNSKDAFKEKETEINKRLFFISTSLEENNVKITLQDNAGGIPIDVLPKIFEPYFTTKHQSQGTGLGLNMTYKIIVEGMGGTIEAQNITYDYEEKEYTGIAFIITVPYKETK